MMLLTAVVVVRGSDASSHISYLHHKRQKKKKTHFSDNSRKQIYQNMNNFTVTYTNQPTTSATVSADSVGARRADHEVQQQLISAHHYNQRMHSIRSLEREQKRATWTSGVHGAPGSDLPFMARSLKMGLAEALQYHRRNKSHALAKVMTVPAEAIKSRRGPNGEITLPPTKGQLAAGGKPFTMTHAESLQYSCGIPLYCYRLVMLDLELVIEERGAKVAAQTLKTLPLWRLSL
jgi:hypothetical protein